MSPKHMSTATKKHPIRYSRAGHSGAPRAISRAARSAGADVRAALSELAEASKFAALPRRRDERAARA